jgi:hypothetical protein
MLKTVIIIFAIGCLIVGCVFIFTNWNNLSANDEKTSQVCDGGVLYACAGHCDRGGCYHGAWSRGGRGGRGWFGGWFHHRR